MADTSKTTTDLSPQISVSIIIPAYNEVLTLAEILKRIHAVPISKQLIIVDDGSTDGTTKYLKSLVQDLPRVLPGFDPTKLTILYHSQNRGKGAAIRTGLPHATEPITLIQDADLEYNPQEYIRLVEPIVRNEADVVYGSRFRGEAARIQFFWHALANKLLTLIADVLNDLNLTDLTTGYKVFRTDIIQSIPIRSNRFGFEAEITAKVAKLRCRLFEVPVSYAGRTYEEGKKVTWRDGIALVLTSLHYWFVDDLYEKTAGLRTLRIMEGAGSYNRWLFERCSRFLGDKVLEVGAGVGNISKFLLDREMVIATDVSPTYVAELQSKFSHLPNVHTRVLDLCADKDVSETKQQFPIDTVLSMNMLEHIEDDRQAVASMFRLLQPGGRLVLLVPAHQQLFSDMDRNLDHFRRYDRVGLGLMLEQAGFKIRESRYLNWLGALGWFVNGRLLRRQLIPSRQLRLFDLMLFFLKTEDLWAPPFGLSLLIVAERP